MKQGGRQRLRYKADGRTFVETRSAESRTLEFIRDTPVGEWKAPLFLRARTTGGKQLSWTAADSVTEFKTSRAENALGLALSAPIDPDTRLPIPYSVAESAGRRLSLPPPIVRGDSLDAGAQKPFADESGAHDALHWRAASSGAEESCPSSMLNWDMLEEAEIMMGNDSGLHTASVLDHPQPPGVVQDLEPVEELRAPCSLAAGGQNGASLPVSPSMRMRPMFRVACEPLVQASPTAATVETSPGGPSSRSIADNRQMLLQARSMRSFKRAQKSLGPRDWRRQRDKVELWLLRWNLATAICGVCGVAAACLQHELVVRGWDPSSFEVNVLKIVNSCATCVLLGEAFVGRLLLWRSQMYMWVLARATDAFFRSVCEG